MRKRFVLPAEALRPYVDRIWGWESAGPIPLPVLFPGTGAEIVFHYGAPFAICNGRGEIVGRQARGIVSFLLPEAYQLVATGPVGFVSVRVRGEAVRHFAHAPFSEWRGGFTPVNEALGPAWADMTDLLAEAPDFETRVRMVEERLQRHLAQRDPKRALIDRAVTRLYYQSGSVRIGDVADDLNMSARHFERLFLEATGRTPKRFQRAARLHHVVRRVLVEQRDSYLDAALEGGFYDQAHFIHECRAITGSAPSQWFQRGLYLSHFYNPRLRA